MVLWLKHSSAFTYADDPCSSVTVKMIEEVKLKLEDDAEVVLKFMASNGLVAKPLIILNQKAGGDVTIIVIVL